MDKHGIKTFPRYDFKYYIALTHSQCLVINSSGQIDVKKVMIQIIQHQNTKKIRKSIKRIH